MKERFAQFYSSISSIHKTMQKIERDEMARFGLKGAHVQCLLALEACPEGATVSRLCALCEKDKAAVSRTVAELEARGMICGRGRGDRLYRAPLRLSEAGAETAERIGGIVEKAVELAGEGLSEGDRRIFYRTLDLIAGNLQRISREGVPCEEERKTNL